MTALMTAGPISTYSLRRFVALLTSRVRTLRSSRSDAGSAGGEPSRPLDLGDLSVAQYVHDLRNQLTVIMACTDSVARLLPLGCGDVEIAALRQCAQRSSVLTRDLLMAARPRAAKRVALDLNEVIASTVVSITRLVAPHIRLRLLLAASPVVVIAEALEIERILINLVLNSCDAMAGTSVPNDGSEALLTIETAVMKEGPRASPTSKMPHARLTVSDTGQGMTAGVEKRIFEPFFTTRPAGTGLGLSSVAFTVRQLRGTVAVTSAPQRGTTISVYIPAVA